MTEGTLVSAIWRGSSRDALRIYWKVEFRLGAANTLLALGDLYVRTARFKQVEQSYPDLVWARRTWYRPRAWWRRRSRTLHRHSPYLMRSAWLETMAIWCSGPGAVGAFEGHECRGRQGWHEELACSLGEPNARAHGERLARVFDGLGPVVPPPAELVEQIKPGLSTPIQCAAMRSLRAATIRCAYWLTSRTMTRNDYEQ